MLILQSAAALFVAQFLPGLLIVKLLDIGRDREERFVLAAVLSGPVAALFYLVTVLSSWEPLYWILVGNAAIVSLVVPYRTPAKFAWPAKTRLALGALVVAVCVPYLLTTGSAYRPDDGGNLLLDRALQRDVLFHVGITESLLDSYPPTLLSVGGPPVGYHVGYHLQVAAWARFFGVDVIDGLIRTGTVWYLVLLIASAFLLARRFTVIPFASRLVPLLVLCTGFGFLFFHVPSVDWWSLVFMDVTLVSVLLVNPLLPALPLLMTGLALLGDYLSAQGRGALVGSTCCFAFLLVVKMFLGAQLLAALGLAVVTHLADRRLRRAFVVITLASLPFLAHTFLAASGSNTSVTLRPFEIVRYSMEKLDWTRAVDALAEVGRLDASLSSWSIAIGVVGFWFVGFSGLRLAGLSGWARDLFDSRQPLRRTMAWFVLVGFPVALTFRIAPEAADSLSRLDAQNDIVWFAAASGILLWFWTAESLPRRWALVAVAVVALPATVQHFAYEASLERDRIPRESVLAARAARVFSEPGSLWLDPLDRSRPSVLPYLAGRPVVYDPYVGYDYMFVGRDETDFRRHAMAQFWSSDDPAFRAWVIDHYGVDYVMQIGEENPVVRGLEQIYSLETVHLYRVHASFVARQQMLGIRTPTSLSLGAAGSPYFGREFKRNGQMRLLEPGRTHLYLPRGAGQGLAIAIRVQPNHGGGTLVVDGEVHEIAPRSLNIRFTLPPRDVNGLHAVELTWTGDSPLVIFEFRLNP